MKKISKAKLLNLCKKLSKEWRRWIKSDDTSPGLEVHGAVNDIDRLFPGKTACQIAKEMW